MDSNASPQGVFLFGADVNFTKVIAKRMSTWHFKKSVIQILLCINILKQKKVSWGFFWVAFFFIAVGVLFVFLFFLTQWVAKDWRR